MQCPSCQNTDSRVLESRSAESGRSVRRRRECLNCDFRFTTYERVETTPITVLKKSGAKELFNRSKIISGLNRACEKTLINSSKIEFINDYELKVILQGKFTTERGRINCSLREASGDWRWLGIQFIISEL